jgi:hypothetical protein
MTPCLASHPSQRHFIPSVCDLRRTPISGTVVITPDFFKPVGAKPPSWLDEGPNRNVTNGLPAVGYKQAEQLVFG